MKRLLREGGRWLDVACGTGYFLSRFPGVPRAGLDISPAMLAIAREANPDALFFREGDFTDEFPEWERAWSVITCLWYSYGLVESITAVETLVRNLASWTADDGVCFVPIFEPANLGRGVKLPYVLRQAGQPPETILITGVTWSWIEASGKRHDHMVAPQMSYMVSLFERYFASVEVVLYPPFKLWRRRRRRAIIGRGKKPDAHQG
ncbi:MAG TPA: class I SAM-dependent methyltransferase [Candidatus Binatia bacterium]|nr:class I SAM-dependent methyltransferase [Candidatus Binatia bacterium]